MKYKVMCWDSVDNRCNVFNIPTYEEAEETLKDLESTFPNHTFQICKDLSNEESDEELKNILKLSDAEVKSVLRQNGII